MDSYRHRRVYDNWARLVEATLDREKLRQIALSHSRDTSFSSSSSPDLSASGFNFRVNSRFPDEPVYLKLRSMAKPVLQAIQLMRAADGVTLYRKDCLDLKSRAQKLAELLGKAEHAMSELYDRPTRRVIHDTSRALYRASSLVLKCRSGKRAPTDVPAAEFADALSQLDGSIRNLCWLLCLEDLSGAPPPISLEEPTLCHVWELVATLCTGLIEDQCRAAASLVSLANEDKAYRKLIIEEGGVRPLLRFLLDLKSSQQISAAIFPGSYHLISALHRTESGIRWMFDLILKEGPMKVHVASWPMLAVLMAHFGVPSREFRMQDDFLSLISHLEFTASTFNQINGDQQSKPDFVTEIGSDDLTLEMVGRALWNLTRGDSAVCQSMEAPSTLLGFAGLLKGPEAVQYWSAMTLLKVTAAAEEDWDFRTSVFNSNSPARTAICKQLFRIVREAAADSELLVPCVKSIGNLAKTFGAKETRKIISLLLKLLQEQEANVPGEACVALTKFARIDNYARPHRCKVIVSAGGAKSLVGLVYSGGQILQRRALVLLCYVALHLPQCSELVEAEALEALRWASGKGFLDEDAKKLLPKTMYAMEWYKSRGYKGR